MRAHSALPCHIAPPPPTIPSAPPLEGDKHMSTHVFFHRSPQGLRGKGVKRREGGKKTKDVKHARTKRDKKMQG